MGSIGSSSSSLIGDYIGIESCLDLKDNDDIFLSSAKERERDQIFSLRRSRKEQKPAAEKEFPPPIPLLARTENLPCHMPWVLKRYYTSDGRLILKEERVRHHGYFRAERCNGRLTLQLVPLDDEVYRRHHSSSHEDNNANGNGFEDVLDDAEGCENEEKNENEKRPKEEEGEGEEEGEIESENMHEKGNGTDKEDEVHGDGIMKKKLQHDEEAEEAATSMDNGNGGNVSAFKCFNYNKLTRRPGSISIFEMPVPAMRPIHS